MISCCITNKWYTTLNFKVCKEASFLSFRPLLRRIHLPMELKTVSISRAELAEVKIVLVLIFSFQLYVYYDSPGYRFFVMERMDKTISHVVPHLLKNKSSSKTINFGEIAVKLLACVQAVHGTKNIIRDVKTENFMLTLGEGQSGSTIEKKLASRIRLLDLAMAAQWTSMYRETDIGDSLIGTPLYASLNVHNGKKSSFRDDLESLGYILAELLIQLHYGDPSKQLPWSEGKSDEDIGSMKESLVEDKDSEFYHQLGNAKTVASFLEYMKIVRGYSFKTVPDYDKLSKILAKLTVSTKVRATPSKKAAPLKRTRRKASNSNDDASPTKVARRITRSSRRRDMDIEEKVATTNDNDQSIDETVYADAHQYVEDMDWEYTIDENEEPKMESEPKGRKSARRNPAPKRQQASVSKRAKKKVDNMVEEQSLNNPSRPLKRRGVSILFTEGPHKGESYEIEAGVNETVFIGSKPSSNVGEALTLKKDKLVKNTHVRLDLSINRKLTAVKVTDKSKGMTFVNRDAVKSTKAFINDTITIGDTSFQIRPL